MKKNLLWLILILAWLLVTGAYLIFWPPTPRGEIYSLLPVQDQTAIVLQGRWEDDSENPIVLMRQDANLKVLWQQEIDSVYPGYYFSSSLLWADQEKVYLNLPIFSDPSKSRLGPYKIMAFSLDTGELAWESGPIESGDPEWRVAEFREDISVTGCEGKLFTFHEFESSEYEGTGGLNHWISVKAWDSNTGTLLWEKSDWDKDEVYQPVIPEEKDNPFWQSRRADESLFTQQMNHLVTAIPLPEADVLWINGSHDIWVAIQVSTGKTLHHAVLSRGHIGREAFLYNLNKWEDTTMNAPILMQCEFSTQVHSPVPWWPQFEKPENMRLLQFQSQGTYKNLDIYHVEMESTTNVLSESWIIAVNPLSDSIEWQLRLGTDIHRYNPHNPSYLLNRFPNHLPLSGTLNRYIPLLIQIDTATSDYKQYGKYALLLLDLETQEYKIVRWFEEICPLDLFASQDRIYIHDQVSSLAIYNSEKGFLEYSIGNKETANMGLSPGQIKDGLIWVSIGTEIAVLDAKTLAVVSGENDLLYDNLTSNVTYLGLSQVEP